MAKNSLFAILLRSPWWISAALAIAVGLVSYALLPESVRGVGLFGGAPFAVIAAMAAWRRRGLPSPARVEATRAAVAAMAWPAFAALLEQAFRRQGYQVTRRGPEPVDFELERQGRRTLVSARRWKSAQLGLESLRALQRAREAAARARTGDDAADRPLPAAIWIGLGAVGEAAGPYAREQGIVVWQLPELAQALKHLPLTT